MIDLIEIKHLLPEQLYEVLMIDDAFEMPKLQALEIIRARTGIVLETPRPKSLDWTVLPFSFLVEFFAGDKLSGLSSEAESRRIKKYDEAFKILDLHKIHSIKAVLGEIEGLD